MTAIQTSGLGKVYTKRLTRKVVALKDLNLEVERGEIFGFLGPNGAGKSTTIKLLMNLIRPTTGDAKILGIPVTEASSRKKLGYLPEEPNYYGYVTAKELLEMVGRIHGLSGPEIEKQSTEILSFLDLPFEKRRTIAGFSKGMVQRVGLAQAIFHDPEVVVLDEPMSGLDPPGRKLVADLMLRMRDQGKTIFFSTHILHDVEVVCDRIGIITGGQLRFCGTLAEVISETFSSYEVVLRKVQPEQVRNLKAKGFAAKTFEDNVKVDVSKEDLPSFVDAFVQHGTELVAIEPKRFTLEDFFMGFIDSAEASSRRT
ncbi:MAG: ABC transporter ATP-binding protein [Deltaproteobacteria bacterium]|nr:MAG: ABC transporter ATP-binding protein [Deltaproteobacteria bacterium]